MPRSSKNSSQPASANKAEVAPASSEAGITKQAYNCSKKNLRGLSKIPSACFVCAERGRSTGGTSCRFRGFRMLGGDSPSFEEWSPSTVVRKSYRMVFNDKLKRLPLEQLRNDLAVHLQPFVNLYQAHEAQPRLIRRIPEAGHRLTCDFCSTSLFMCSYFCEHCGFEVCLSCHSDLESCSAVSNRWPQCSGAIKLHSFRAVSRFPAGEVGGVANDVMSILSAAAAPDTPDKSPAAPEANLQARNLKAKADATPGRQVPELTLGQSVAFRFLWWHRIPIVFRDIRSRLKGQWDPSAFVRSHGSDLVSMITSGRQKPTQVTVREFFEKFQEAAAEPTGDTVKIKDWPPSANFSDKFSQYFASFMDAVPMPSYTRYDGFMNLAAHYPDFGAPYKSFKPDLGPKMYIATADLVGEGSTILHIDVTSAVNILVHVEASKVPSDNFAEWYIFSADDTATLREYLLQRYPELGRESDPIHAQRVYITPQMLDDLKVHSVEPFVIHQRVGDAIFIPAGCAHQVTNRAACIKVACDFISIEGIAASKMTTAEFRALGQEDILQLEATMWHAWMSLTEQNRQLDPASEVLQDPQNSLTRTQKKRKAQRQTAKAKDDQRRRKRLRKSLVSESHPNSPARSESHPIPPSQSQYKCPHVACEESKRAFAIEGVLSHLQASHGMVFDKSVKKRAERMSSDEFGQEFRGIASGTDTQASSSASGSKGMDM